MAFQIYRIIFFGYIQVFHGFFCCYVINCHYFFIASNLVSITASFLSSSIIACISFTLLLSSFKRFYPFCKCFIIHFISIFTVKIVHKFSKFCSAFLLRVYVYDTCFITKINQYRNFFALPA